MIQKNLNVAIQQLRKLCQRHLVSFDITTNACKIPSRHKTTVLLLQYCMKIELKYCYCSVISAGDFRSICSCLKRRQIALNNFTQLLNRVGKIFLLMVTTPSEFLLWKTINTAISRQMWVGPFRKRLHGTNLRTDFVLRIWGARNVIRVIYIRLSHHS